MSLCGNGRIQTYPRRSFRDMKNPAMTIPAMISIQFCKCAWMPKGVKSWISH